MFSRAVFILIFFAFDMPKLFFSRALSKIFLDSFNTIYFYFSEPETWFLLICMCQFWWIIFLYKVIFKAFFTFYRTLFFSTKISIFLTLSQDWLWFFALVFCSCFFFIGGPREVGRTHTQNRKMGTPPLWAIFAHTPQKCHAFGWPI